MLQECKRANHQQGKRVTILGAGIAGLVAAYELERLGHQVDVMEGSPRWSSLDTPLWKQSWSTLWRTGCNAHSQRSRVRSALRTRYRTG